MSDDNRLQLIETKLAHQEDLVQSLNGTVSSQQQQIARLEERYRQLAAQVVAAGIPSLMGADDERPPHY